MRTPQEALRDAMPAIQAAAVGKAIQVRKDRELEGKESDYNWNDVAISHLTSFASQFWHWRVKPEPKRTLRPWKPEEVLVGAQIRVKQPISPMRHLIVSCDDAGIDAGRHFHAAFSWASENCEHSTDGGKTWHPCGVWEEEA